MEVKTFYVLVSATTLPDMDQERPGAYTIVKLDGDSKTVVPMREARESGLRAIPQNSPGAPTPAVGLKPSATACEAR